MSAALSVMVQRHCGLLSGSATLQMIRVCLGIQFSRSMLTQQKALGSVTVLKEGTDKGCVWEEGWAQDGVTVKAGNYLLELQSGAQG